MTRIKSKSKLKEAGERYRECKRVLNTGLSEIESLKLNISRDASAGFMDGIRTAEALMRARVEREIANCLGTAVAEAG